MYFEGKVSWRTDGEPQKGQLAYAGLIENCSPYGGRHSNPLGVYLGGRDEYGFAPVQLYPHVVVKTRPCDDYIRGIR